MFTGICTGLKVYGKRDNPSGGVVGIGAIILDIVSGIALLTLAALSITGRIHLSPSAAYYMLPIATFQLSPLLFAIIASPISRVSDRCQQT